MRGARSPLLPLAVALAAAACAHERIVYVVKQVPGPAASCACNQATSPPPVPVSRTCGELLLERAALRAYGKGERHPEVLAVEAKLAECKDSAPTPAECAAVRAELEALRTSRGPMHPDVRAKEAELAVCPSAAP